MDKLPDLTTRKLGRTLVHLEQVDSTNKYLKENGGKLPNLTAVIADAQTHGKGRGDRTWSSDSGDGLYLSLLLKDTSLQYLSRLPLLVAIGVRRGLEALCGLPFQIKWSNDLLHEGGKICGILCESRVLDGQNLVTIGIGVNLGQSREALARHGLVYASSLFLATNKLFSPKETASALCNALEDVILANAQSELPHLWEEYRRHCVTLGRQVRVITKDGEREGRAVDIAADGSLICEIDGKKVPISAGEATIRGEKGYL